MTKVKICGITNPEDAAASVGFGADGIGFVFYEKSPRYIEPQKAGEIISTLPPFITTFGLFVNDHKERIKRIIEQTGINIIQLHGDESPEYCRSFSGQAVKAIRIKDAESLKDLERYPVRAFLLDAYSDISYGGSGITFNWDLAVSAKRFGRIILAGGLTIDNLKEAIDKVMPYGVDVSSGVEKEPGIKDHYKLKRFIEIAKGLIPP